MKEDVTMGSSGGYDFSSYQVKPKTKIGNWTIIYSDLSRRLVTSNGGKK